MQQGVRLAHGRRKTRARGRRKKKQRCLQRPQEVAYTSSLFSSIVSMISSMEAPACDSRGPRVRWRSVAARVRFRCCCVSALAVAEATAAALTPARGLSPSRPRSPGGARNASDKSECRDCAVGAAAALPPALPSAAARASAAFSCAPRRRADAWSSAKQRGRDQAASRSGCEVSRHA